MHVASCGRVLWTKGTTGTNVSQLTLSLLERWKQLFLVCMQVDVADFIPRWCDAVCTLQIIHILAKFVVPLWHYLHEKARMLSFTVAGEVARSQAKTL